MAGPDGARPNPERPEQARLEGLDVLRGVAVLGIFAVNIQAFAMIDSAYANPTVQMDFGPEGQLAWRAATSLFLLKFVTIFSALFGAGLLLAAERGASLSDQRRRLLWLAAFGAAHAFVLWFGDILLIYAVFGLAALSMRTWPTGRLVVLGLVFVTLTGLIMAGVFAALALVPMLPPEEAVEAIASWAPSPETVAAETLIWRSSLIERWPHLAATSVEFQLSSLFFGGRILGVMMLGMALYRSGFFALRWSTGAYAALGLGATAAGLLASDWAARGLIGSDFAINALVVPQMTLYAASLVQALGYAALVMWACTAPALAAWRAPFAAVGRMAFTNYLGMSLAAVLIFCGPPGFGLIGALDRVEQWGVVFAFWSVMILASTAWLARYRQGPLEALWRRLASPRQASPGQAISN